MVSFTFSATLLAAASALVANAQVNCVYASWASNGDSQNPCEVWQKLGQICSSSFTVSPLQVTTNNNGSSPGYPPPSAGTTTPNDACQCNHIAYSLMAACSWCQDGVYSDSWVTESDWSNGCTSAYVGDGISNTVNATGLNIPPYALQPIPGPVWDPTDAQAAQVRLGSSGTTSGPNQHNGAVSTSVKLASAFLLVPVTLSMFL